MRLSHLCAAVLLGALLTVSAASGQAPPRQPVAAAPAPAKSEPPALTPAQAQSVLDVLNDPQKRAAFTATLQNMLKVTAPAKQAAAVPLAPDSVGAQVIAESGTWLAELGGQVSAFRNVLGDLPAVEAFTVRTLQNPASRDRVLTAAWRLSLVLIVAILMEWGFYLLLKRPIAALDRRAPPGSLTPPAEAAAEASAGGDRDTAQAVLRERRFARMLRVIKRIPFMLARLVLELLPVATFLGLGIAGLSLADAEGQTLLRVVITAYVACRLAVVLARAIASPGYRSLRMVHLSDEGAAYTVRWVRRLALVAAIGYVPGAIGEQFGMPPGARLAFSKAVMLIDHGFLVVIVLQTRAKVAHKIRGTGRRRGFGQEMRRWLASVWHLAAVFFIVALWLVWAAQVRNGYDKMWHLFVVTAAVLVAARVAGIILLAALDRAFQIKPEMARRYPTLEAQANRYYPLVRGTLVALLFVATALGCFQAWGVHVLLWFRTGALGGQLFSAALTILIAGIVSLVVWEATTASMERQIDHLDKHAQVMKGARLRTLMPILRTVLLMTLIAVFGLTVLSQIGVNIAPLLAGAGILGVAIGFGSQKLVQDFITGIFLLLENAMQVGDAVTVAGLSGAVENLSIRTMRLRAGDGSVHIIPFSSVTTVTNANRGVGNAAVSVSVPVAEDTDQVSDALADIARDMRQDRQFDGLMRSDLQLWGVDKVDGGNVTIVGQIVCTDGGRWSVQREFNRRVNIRFKELGIRIATPVQTVFNHAVPPPEPKPQIEDAAPPPETVRESPPPSALGNTS